VKTNEKSAQLSRNPKESGQAIVLVALVMVALLAATGMAVDGGGLYFLYRDAQNATDSAALAAAYTLCTNPDSDWMGTAELSLSESGFADAIAADDTNIHLLSNAELAELTGESGGGSCDCGDDVELPSEPVLIRGYNVQLMSRVYTGGQTTFTYQVTGTDTPPDLSHFTLEIPSCLNLVSYSPSNPVEIGTDPTTGVNGIKWDFGVDMSDSQTYTVTFDGEITLGEVTAAVKGGPGYEALAVPGPGCGSCSCGNPNFTYAIEVTIDAEKPSYFIQVVYPEPLSIHASTIAYCNAGSPVDESGEPVERTKYAFDIRSPMGTCTSNYSFSWSGTGNAIYGDIQIGDTVMGGGPTTPGANPVYGDMTIARSETEPPNHHISHLREETTPGPLYEGTGDGTIEWGTTRDSSYDPMPWNNWSDVEWGGSVQLANASNYHLLSCSVDGKVFRQEGKGWEEYDTDGNPGNGLQLEDGIYIPNYVDFGLGGTCTDDKVLEINGNMFGNVTVFHRGKIETSGSNNQLTPYWQDVLLASNRSRPDPQACAGGDHSIRLSGGGETLQGDIIVNANGHIWANGNNSTYESCFSAWSIRITGNNSNYFCQPGGAPPESSGPTIGIIE